MNRRRRLALLATPLVLPLTLASTVGAQAMSDKAPASSSAAAPSKAVCAVVRNTDAPGQATFALRGEGFKEGSKVAFLGPGAAGTGFTVDADGAFVVPITTNGQYHIQVDAGEATIKCAKSKGEQSQKDEERAAGFTAGFNAVKANCQAKEPQGIAPHTATWEKGWDAGAAAAAAKFC